MDSMVLLGEIDGRKAGRCWRTVSAPDGTYLHDLATPRNETFGDGVGPRENRGLEGVTFAQNGELVVSVLESSLRQDGPESSRSHGSLSRITVQRATGELVAQYAYPLDALPDVTPVGSYGSLIGISAILSSEPATATRFLLIERAYVSGYNHRIRIYEADCANATDVASLPSLVDAQFCPAQKRLLADLGVPGPPNFEGMTRAPELPTGERVLLLISDNDFRETCPCSFSRWPFHRRPATVPAGFPSRRRGHVRRAQGEGVKPDDQIFQPVWTHGIVKVV
jgi:hypothetical protein